MKAVHAAKDLRIGGAAIVLADVTKWGELDALYAQVWDEFKRIDVLFANAGVPGAVIASRTPTLEGIFENDLAGVGARDLGEQRIFECRLLGPPAIRMFSAYTARPARD